MAWKVLQKGIDVSAQAEVEAFCEGLNVEIRQGREEWIEVWVDFENVTPNLRRPEVTRASSVLSTYLRVRKKLLSIQRAMAKEGVVAEGRDVGTVVFPDADSKFYLDADIQVRGQRRFKELCLRGISSDIQTVTDEIEARDRRDCQRAVAPLHAAADAIIIDSTFLSLEEVIAIMLQKIAENKKR